MQIAVMIKQVPASNEVFLDPVTHNIIRDGKKAVINPYDRFALELALQLKDEFKAEVHVYTMGIQAASAILREAMSLGADRAFLLSDRAFAGADTLATSYTLHLAIEKNQKAGKNYDIILCGRMAIDGDTAQIGPELAEHLNIAHISDVKELVEADHEKIVIKRLQDGYEQIIEGIYPVLLSIDKDINQPRLPKLDGVLAAYQKEIELLTAADLQADLTRCGLKGSPTRVVKVEVPLRQNNCEFLAGTADEIANKLKTLTLEAINAGSDVNKGEDTNPFAYQNFLKSIEVPIIKEESLSENELKECMGQIWVLAQVVGPNKLHPVNFELLAKAKSLAETTGTDYSENLNALSHTKLKEHESAVDRNEAQEQNRFKSSLNQRVQGLVNEKTQNTKVGMIVSAKIEDEEVLAKAFLAGADFIFSSTEEYNSSSNDDYGFLAQKIRTYKPNVVLVGATDWGRSIAPRLAANLKTGLTADCTELSIKDELLQQTRPAFGGNMMATIICPNNKPQMSTVRPGIFKSLLDDELTRQNQNSDALAANQKSSSLQKAIILCENEPSKNEMPKLLNSRIIKTGQDLQSAKIIFVAGVGIGSKKNLQAMIDLADSLGVTWGVSRPLVDIGWAEHSRQIGQTGQIVAPDLLVSFGVSGAIQHLAGIVKSKNIIALNHDVTASIFNIAVKGVVADCNEILTAWLSLKE